MLMRAINYGHAVYPDVLECNSLWLPSSCKALDCILPWSWWFRITNHDLFLVWVPLLVMMVCSTDCIVGVLTISRRLRRCKWNRTLASKIRIVELQCLRERLPDSHRLNCRIVMCIEPAIHVVLVWGTAKNVGFELSKEPKGCIGYEISDATSVDRVWRTPMTGITARDNTTQQVVICYMAVT